MKYLKGLCVLLMLLLCLTGAAAAEQWEYAGELELLSMGDLPENSGRQTYTSNELKTYLREKLLATSSSINVAKYDLTVDELVAALQEVLNTRPELFNVGRSYSITLSGSKVLSFKPSYKYRGEDLAYWTRVYNDGLKDIVEYASRSDTDIGRIMRINDYICAHYAYDQKYDLINSPELMFEYGLGKCQAYMLVFCAALNELDIPNTYVTSRPMDHAWNMVYLDGDWYHVDATWNDPLNSCPLRANHNHFLLSDQGISESGHYLWSAAEKANNDRYDDMFWKTLYQTAPMVWDVIYYLDGEEDAARPTVRSYDLKTGQSKAHFTYDAPGYVRYGLHPVWATHSRFIYAVDHKVYASLRAGGEPKILCELEEDEHVWGMFLEDRVLKIFAAKDNESDGQIYHLELSDASTLTLQPQTAHLSVGDTLQMEVVMDPPAEGGIRWRSSDPAIAQVDEQGKVQGIKTGAVYITAEYDELVSAQGAAIVHSPMALRLPAALHTVEAEAFCGAAAEEIVLGEGVKTIGSRAFADCAALALVSLSAGVESIADDAFENTPGVMLLCASETGKAYAEAQGLPYLMMIEE